MLAIATQFLTDTCTPTGRTEEYVAESIEAAVAAKLYTERLKDAYARLGPTGRVVYVGSYGWTVTPKGEAPCGS